MGFFSTPNPFDGFVEKATDAKNTTEDWGMIMDMCDRVSSCANGPKDCLKSIMKRLNNPDPHVVIQAITLLDACVNNCGKEFRLEVASRDFESEFRKLLSKSHPKVREKLLVLLKSWAEGEFAGDAQLNLIPSLYNGLKREGVNFSSYSDQPKKAAVSKDPNVVSSQQEEDDIARAIQLSLQESKNSSPKTHQTSNVSNTTSNLYPSSTGSPVTSNPKTEEKKARALYDFEAAEDNELTFKAGEIVIIIDDSDVNWWKGSNHRGSGLFPANFVTTDLEAEPEQFKEEKQQRRSVQFNEDVEVVEPSAAGVELTNEEVVIDEEKINTVLRLLHEADPTSPESDAPELPGLEEQVNAMGPLIDAELESVDRRHAQLTRLSTELVDALNLYHQLMHENVGMMGPQSGNFNPYGSMPGGPQPMYSQQQPYAAYNPQTYMGPVNNMQVQLNPQDPQMYVGSAPPPPTPPLTDNIVLHQQPQHFMSPPINNSAPPNFHMNAATPVAVSGYNPQPQM